MDYITTYHSPLGQITLSACGDALTGLWFDGQKYFGRTLSPSHETGRLPVLDAAALWLDAYFRGETPGPLPPVALRGTPFQQAVWRLLMEIPYGQTTTYGDLADRLSGQANVSRRASQAVGSAVGHNPISILIPCHRVVGSTGSLTGYAGGIEKKLALLTLEGTDTSRFFLPRPKRAR